MGDPLKHSRFYMTTVTFLVEDCLFRLPRGPFETGSTVFRDMFLLPAGDQDALEGSSEAHPIRLEGIKKDDFEQLLKVLFPKYPATPEQLPAGREQWTSVLKLSTVWMFDEARETAIDELASLGLAPVEMFILARDYDITDWLVPTINAIARRPAPIGVQDVEQLGLEVALKIASVREQISLRVVRQHLTYDNGTHYYDTHKLIVGPRASAVEKLDFTPCIRTVFNLS